MMGMNEITGKILEGEAYVEQCVRRVLSGGYVMHRDFPAHLLPSIARAASDTWLLDLTGEVIEKIEAVITDTKVAAVTAQNDSEGKISLRISVAWKDSMLEVRKAV